MKLTYRMHTGADKDELVRLWSTETGWDNIDASVWEHRFVKTPFGEAAIAVAVDEETDKIVGQLIFIPLIARIDGREVSAYRPYAAFLPKNARSTGTSFLAESVRTIQGLNPFAHPMLKMYNLGVESFRERGIDLIYMLPDPLFRRLFKFLPNFHIGSFPLYSLQLPLVKSFVLPEEYKIVEIEPSDERLNELSEKSANFFGCSVVRNSKALSWKTSHFDYFFRGIERNGELIGFADLMSKHRDRQLLICDLLATDVEALRAILIAAVNLANEYCLNHPEQPFNKVAILTTDLLQPIISELGFYRDSYNFLLVIQALNSSLNEQQIAPSRWYASAND